MQLFWKIAPTLVAATALGLVVVQTVRLGKLEKSRPVASSGEEDSEALEKAAALEDRMASLEGAVRRLVGLALTRAPAAGEKAGAPDPVLLAWMQDELKNLRKDVDNVITGDSLETEEGRKKLKDLLKNVRQEERREHRQRFEQVANHLQREQLAQLAKDAGLDQATTDKLDKMLTDERQAMRDVWRAFRSGEKDIPAAIAESRKIRAETDAATRQMLSADQYKAYEQMRQEMPGGRFPFGRLGMGR